MKKRFALLLTLAVFGPHTTLSLAGEANPPAITNASRAMPPTRPLFFKDLAAFDTDKHRSLTLQAERLDFSFAAAASVSAEGDDRVRALRNRLEEGNWLLLVESASGVEIPWTRLQEAKPKAVVRLSES